MLETILVRTPIHVTFVIEQDSATKIYFGHLDEFPGIISQGRSHDAVKRKLVGLLREISRDHPEELRLFQ